MFEVVFAARAQVQLEELYSYIADRDGDVRADRFVASIVERCQNLSLFPERGTRHDDIRVGLRTIGHKRNATIAFYVDRSRNTVAILGIFYGGQDYAAALIEPE